MKKSSRVSVPAIVAVIAFGAAALLGIVRIAVAIGSQNGAARGDHLLAVAITAAIVLAFAAGHTYWLTRPAYSLQRDLARALPGQRLLILRNDKAATKTFDQLPDRNATPVAGQYLAATLNELGFTFWRDSKGPERLGTLAVGDIEAIEVGSIVTWGQQVPTIELRLLSGSVALSIVVPRWGFFYSPRVAELTDILASLRTALALSKQRPSTN